jgi:hypothetical protein
MPLKNGIEATRDILKINGSAKIINISWDKIKEEALASGAVYFIEKSIDFHELFEELNCLKVQISDCSQGNKNSLIFNEGRTEINVKWLNF